MRRFVIHIALYLLATVAAMAALDFCYTKVYEASYPRTKFQLIRSFRDKEIGFAFLGSSRVDNGVVAPAIAHETGKSALNLGFQASKPSDILTILKVLHSYNIKAKQVFIQVDYIYNSDGHSNMMLHEILPFIRDNRATRSHFDFLPDSDALYYIPFYRYCRYDHKIGIREVAMNLSGKKTKTAQNSGYHPLYGQERNSRNALPVSIWDTNPKIDSIRLFAQAHAMPVKFFCVPFDPRTKNLGYIALLKKKLPGLLDYSHAVKDTAAFKNYFHLNDIGAREFTLRFTQNELKKKAP